MAIVTRGRPTCRNRMPKLGPTWLQTWPRERPRLTTSRPLGSARRNPSDLRRSVEDVAAAIFTAGTGLTSLTLMTGVLSRAITEHGRVSETLESFLASIGSLSQLV